MMRYAEKLWFSKKQAGTVLFSGTYLKVQLNSSKKHPSITPNS